MKLPGSDRWVELSEATGLPVGSRIDARRGVARISAALDRDGHTQSASFRGGVFEVRQEAERRGVTDILLRGRLSCARPGAALAAAKRGSRRRRSLWASDDGGRWRNGAEQRGHRARHEMADPGPLRRHPHPGHRRLRRRAQQAHRRRTLVKAGDSYLARDAALAPRCESRSQAGMSGRC